VPRFLTRRSDGLIIMRDKATTHSGRVCMALEGRVGQAVACTIYKDRPTLCSATPAGSELCLAARRRWNLPIL
jgi:Fe-S-cluster containining protein